MLLTITVLLFLTVALLSVTRGKPTPFYITFAFQLSFLVGYYRLSTDPSEPRGVLPIFLLSLAVLVAGYLATTALLRGRDRDHSSVIPAGITEASPTQSLSANETDLDYRASRFLLIFFTILAGYHFAVSGIPLLSPNVELDRWRFTTSGLYGFPGRAYLFGLTLALFTIASRWRFRSRDTRWRRLYQVALLILILTRLLGGFKGELLDVLFLVVALRLTMGTPFRLVPFLRRYSLPFALALAFAYTASLLYSSVQAKVQGGSASVSQLLVDRATTVTARPGYSVLAYRNDDVRLIEGDSLANDFRFYLARYVPGFSTDRFAFKTVVSARTSGRVLVDPSAASALDPGTFVVPVTVGAFPVFYYNYGKAAFAVYFLLGGLFAYAEFMARHAVSRNRSFISIVLVVVLHEFINKGDLIFQVFNWLIMSAAAIVIFLLYRSFTLSRGTVETVTRPVRR